MRRRWPVDPDEIVALLLAVSTVIVVFLLAWE